MRRRIVQCRCRRRSHGTATERRRGSVGSKARWLSVSGGGNLGWKRGRNREDPTDRGDASVLKRGTRLADHERWKALIDRATNLLSALPSSGYHQALTTILTLVKIIGADAVGALPGLSAMAPQSAALAALNRGQSQGTTYYGIAADYRPTDPNLAALMLRRTGDELRDRFFDEPNDGIVPTAGAFDLRHPHPDFPLPPERRWQSAANSPIQHSQLFATPAIVDQMTRWLRDV